MTSPDLVPLPSRWHALRDELRVVGRELVRYSPSFSAEAAARVRHSPMDYEYGLHKVFGIYDNVVHITRHQTFCSEKELSVMRPSHLGAPSTAQVAKSFVKEPANLVLAAVVAPYAAALFGLAALGARSERKHQADVRSKLGRLATDPVFMEL